MSTEKTQGLIIEDVKGGQVANHGGRAQTKNAWLRKPPPDLAKPFGFFYWPLEVTALVVAIVAGLLFARVIDAGALSVHWTITFNVNVAVALIILVAGIIIMLPKALKKPAEVLNSSSIVSMVVLLLVVLYFFSGGIPLGPVKGIDLGTFSYTIAALDFNLLGSALLAIVLFCLAFRRSYVSILSLLVLFLWWGFSIEGLDFSIFSDFVTSQAGTSLLRTMVPPSWNYFGSVIQPMLLT
ncbi:MAG TPA: hypothetical protein VGN34_20000, partial [Ktedonobacteraceae bacterium]